MKRDTLDFDEVSEAIAPIKTTFSLYLAVEVSPTLHKLDTKPFLFSVVVY
ncbi:hypothetical protein [Nostoc sp. LEGE 12450]|nr:hypothetical protein [Nostoc sp. LEGE 12450]MBE8986965.1 hypothetical protein [Nostoc sp. LEGE 12450]